MFSSLIDLIDSIRQRDPASRSRAEVLLYPGLHALMLHRLAHWLYRGQLFFLARMVNHFARFITAIDIHPGARIGKRLFIDHGFVVIGETSEIGDDVTIYQGATLGGRNPSKGENGKRHPTIGNGVVISLGAAILGPIHVGEQAQIAANAVVTRDVAPGAIMVGIPARPLPRERHKKKDPFVPYGTPCGQEQCDIETRRIEPLQREIEKLEQRIAALTPEAAQAAPTADKNAGDQNDPPRARA